MTSLRLSFKNIQLVPPSTFKVNENLVIEMSEGMFGKIKGDNDPPLMSMMV